MKRFLSLLLAIAMIVTMLPNVTVFANEEQPTAPEVVVPEVPSEPEANEPEVPESVTPTVSEEPEIQDQVQFPLHPNEVYDYAKEMDFSAGGTVTAVCPVCGTEAAWQPMAISAGTDAPLEGHYYLEGDLTSPCYYVQGTAVCLNLNGYSLTSTGRAIYVSSVNGRLNVMGDGTVSGDGQVTSNSLVFGALDVSAEVNLFGGTYVSSKMDTPAVSVRNKNGKLNVYEGAILYNNAGGNALTVNNYASANIYGGSLGNVYINKGAGELSISGEPVIDRLTLVGGKLLKVGEMGSAAAVKVAADGVFTEALEEPQNVVSFFLPAEAGKQIVVENGALAIRDEVAEITVFDLQIEPVKMTVNNGGAHYPGYYQYYWWMDMQFTVTMSDGAVIKNTGTSFEYKGVYYDLSTSDTQSGETPWLAGNTYSGTVSLEDITVTVPVTIEDSFISNIVFTPLELMEETHGDLVYDQPDTPYYKYYWWNYLQFTVYTKNGDVIDGSNAGFWYNDVWYNMEWADSQNDENPWIGGNSYTGQVSIAGYQTSVNVMITYNPIQSVVFDPITIVEKTGGVFEVGRYWYWWWNDLSGTVTFRDGITERFDGLNFIHNGETYSLGYNTSQDDEWVAGNTYEATVYLLGKEYKVPVSIAASEITAITADPLTIPAGSCGSLVRCDGNAAYFHYRWWDYITCNVTFRDGTEIKVTGDTFSYNGVLYTLETKDSQQGGAPWLAGTTYNVSLSVAGFTTEVQVAISVPQADRIELPTLHVGNSQCDIVERGQIATFKFVPEVSGTYSFVSSAMQDTYGYVFDADGDLLACDDDGGGNTNFMMKLYLEAGKVYLIGARYYSNEYTGSFSLDIRKCVGIDRIEFAPISIPMNTNGSFEHQENGSYYRYYWWNRLSYTAYFEDGGMVQSSGGDFWYGDNYYAISYEDNQSLENPWTQGNTYEVLVTLDGKQYPVQCAIEASHVQSVKLNPIAMLKEGNGYYEQVWNEATQMNEEYFRYYWWNCINYEITFVDGTSVNGSGSGYNYKGQYYNFEYEDIQMISPWQVGGTYYPVVYIAGERYEVQVSVQPVNLQSVTFSPVVMMEHTGGCWQNSYSGDYYEYYWWNNLQYTIVLANGHTITSNGTSVYLNGQWANIQYRDTQNYENQFVKGGIYDKTVRVFGYEVPVQICITDTVGGSAGENIAWSLDADGNFNLSGTGALHLYNSSDGMEWWNYKEQIRTVTIGEGITDMQQFAFYGCNNLERVNIGANVENLGRYTFAYCSSLREVNFSDSVKVIGNDAFRDCVMLESVVLGNNVQTVGNSAFSYCSNLKTLTLPATLTELRDWSFYPCSDLQNVYYMGTETAWNDVMHDGHTGLQGIYVQCLGVAETIDEGTCGDLTWKFDSDGLLTFEGTGMIPDYTEDALPAWAAYADGVRLVKLGEGVTGIGNYAFYEFYSLQRVDMEYMVEHVGDYAFYNCDSLTSFMLRQVETVGSYAFAECDSFFYTCFGGGELTIGDYAFYRNGVTEVEYSGSGYKFYQQNIGIGNDNLLNANICGIEEPGVVLSGRCGEKVYFIHYETGELKVFGEGAIFDCESEMKPWDRFAYPVFAITIEEGITEIGSNAFAGCGNAKTLTLPTSLRYIGDSAFFNLANVKNVIIPEGVEEIGANAFAFSGMESLSLPDSLKVIGWEAFRQCDCLEEIFIPKGVEKIEGNAFMASHAMTAIRVAEENLYYSSDDRGILYNKDKTVLVCAPCFISGSVTVPETVTTVKEYAFAHCTDLEEVVMGDDVTEVGHHAFWGCYALDSVTFGSGVTTLSNGIFQEAGFETFVIPAGITEIGANAFQGCEHLSEVVIPDSVISIGEYAFAYCISLTSADIPASVTYVGEHAFYCCDMLAQVTVPEGVTQIGSFAFADCYALTEITIPDSVETVGAYAFIGCTNLTSVTMGKNVSEIGDSAFEGCVALTEVSVPEGVTSFVYRLFAGCTSLEKIDIPASVQSIGDMTFADCNTLTEITVPDSVESIGAHAFKQCENLSVVNIGKNVSAMGYNPFYACNNLTAIRVHEDNDIYSSDSYGALYENETHLLRVPAKLSGAFVIPDGVEAFDFETFAHCTEITELTVPDSMRFIPNAAFQDCRALQKITLGEGIQEIGDMAFSFCESLEEIVIPDTVMWMGGECFIDCHNLKSVRLSAGLSEIQPYTFAWCYGLESVTIPKNISVIHMEAFAGCNALTEVIYEGRMSDWSRVMIMEGNGCLYNAKITALGDSEVLYTGTCGENLFWSMTAAGALTVYGEGAMDNYYDGTPAPWAEYASEIRSVEIRTGVTTVGRNAFAGCDAMISAQVAETVTVLGAGAFNGCCSLRDVELHDGLVTLEANVFNYCWALETLSLPNTVETLGTNLFAYCGLRQLHIPASVTTIDGDLFHTTSVIRITVDGNNPNFAGDMQGALYNKNMTTLLRAPCAFNGRLTVPEGVETIGSYAFYGCAQLFELHLPESLKEVAAYGFAECPALSNVYYAGSENDWCNVTINSPLNANIHFAKLSNLGEGTCGDNLSWVLDPEGVLTISGSGDMYSYEDAERPWENLCDQITFVIVEDGVTSIGAAAFQGCANITAVQLANTVERVESHAFYNCRGIASFSMPTALHTIGEHAFAYCTGLESVYNNAVLNEIGAYAFYGCTNLRNYWFHHGLTALGNYAFANTAITSVILPATLQQTGENVFAGSKLTDATIESGELVRLGDYFFMGCEDLKVVNLGSTLQELGDAVFQDCINLETVLMPESLTALGISCFYGCRSLTAITIPDGVTCISQYAFHSCENLMSLALGAGVDSIDSYAFYGTGISSLNAGSNLRMIGEYAFSNCQRLMSVSGIDNVTYIGDGAFRDCYSLQSFTVPAGVNRIGYNTFASCYNLQSVSMSTNINRIYSYAFEGCSNLRDIYYEGNIQKWEMISKDEGNDALNYANIVCAEAPENLYFCPHCNCEVTWEDWNGSASASGHFRLTQDYYGSHIMVGSTSISNLDLILDLNGYGYYSQNRAFTVYKDNCLTVMDSVGSGVISGGATTTIGGAVLVSGGTFHLLGGTLTSQTTNSGGCVYVTNNGNFYMHGGQLIGGCLSNGRRGGALYVAENCYADIASGLITDGNARGASIYTAPYSTLYLGSCTVGEVLTAYDSYIWMYGCPVVEALDLTSGVKVNFDTLDSGSRITVYSDGSFTYSMENAEQYLAYFNSGFEDTVIVVENGELKVSYPFEQEVIDLMVMEMPYKWQYEQGEALELDGLLLTVFYADGYEDLVDSGYSWYGFDSEVPGTKTVYVNYEGFETCFNVVVNEKRVTGMQIHEYPVKSEYYMGEYLDTYGLVLQVTYSNGDVEYIADGYSLDTDILLALGAQTIVVSYENFTDSFNVTVFAREVEIIKQPESVLCNEGDTAYFHVEANNVAAYRWEVNMNNGLGWCVTDLFGDEETDSFAVPAELVYSGYAFRCVLTAADGKVTYTNEVTLEVIPNVIYVTNIRLEKLPEKLTYNAGEQLDLTGMELIASYNYGDDQVIADGYTISGFDTNAAGEQVITVTYEGATATFTVTVQFMGGEIVTQPQDVNADTGTTVNLTVGVKGNVTSYRWQYTKGDGKWYNTTMSSSNTATLSLTAIGARHGYQYRCVVTFADGSVETSKSATLTVNTSITITDQPNDQVVVLGYKGQFTVVVDGEELSYQWQYKRPDMATWFNTNMEGANRPTLLVETTKARDGYQYRCCVSDNTGNIAYSEPATMTVLSFTKQPVDVYSPVNGKVQFKVKASTESGFTYRWQYRRNANGSWTNTSMTGYNTDTLTVEATKARNGYQYRCVLTGSKNSKLESSAATLHVSDPVAITAQPASVVTTASKNAVFSVEATNVLSYQWYYRRPNTITWYMTSATGNKTDTLTVAAKGKNGYQYYCKIIGMDGQEYATDVVTLKLQ